MDLEIVSAPARPDLKARAAEAFRGRWPEFLLNDSHSAAYTDRVGEYFAEHDIWLLDGERVTAGGWGVPIAWDGTPDGLPEGYDAALIAAVQGHEAGVPANAFSVMGAIVASGYEGQGLSRPILHALVEHAAAAGLARVVAPVRPTSKSEHPHMSMSEYAGRTREDGLSVDPWIRTHQRMGATIIGPARNSLVIAGRVAEWETWAQMSFPVSGSYAVPGALNLLDVDRGRDRAVYSEENLWMQHR